MKILHLSDLHVEPVGRLAYAKANTAERLIQLGQWLHQNDNTYDAIAVTGDLSCDGNRQAYELLRTIFSQMRRPCFMVPGNHDRRPGFLEILGEFCQGAMSNDNLSHFAEFDDCRLCFLDTLQPGIHWGALSEETLERLDRELAKDDRPALVFMHHTPVKSGMGYMDEPFGNGDRLLEILSRYENVRLCTGHLHRPVVTLKAKTAIVTAPSVSLQMVLDLRPEGGDEFIFETPGYALHTWREDGWVTHFGQLPFVSDFSGPHPFVGSVNPDE